MRTSSSFVGRAFCAVVVGLSLFARGASGASAVTVSVDVNKAGDAIAPDYLGLSFETEKILAETGAHYFSPTNKALIATFKTLAIKNLRIGGNTADRAGVKVPDERDVD